MRIINYNQINELSVPLIHKRFELRERIAVGLERYCRDNNQNTKFLAENSLSRQLRYILYGLDGQLEGKTILDLGCGNNNGRDTDPSYMRYFEPWLCRALKIIGANPIGIDLEGLDDEEFTHYHVNLAEPNCLAMIPDQSVDLANASAFFDSPFLNLILRKDSEKVKQNLLPQLERILKPNASFIYNK